eukprot:TRINITY_DN14640_c0_g1_i1.p1 TRINITY_DN14640_c0_g1~~TRINITY_DN14640_c0_g1_i1.p1  ORF type:complete len:157 (-),score=39.02 TRINITY_DN14640_c0_g1_i1:174-644(-)
MLSRAFLRAPSVVSTIRPATYSNFVAVRLFSSANNRRYTKTHEWVSVNNGVGTIGITDYAQGALGDIVFVELPKVGKAVKAGSSFGAIESVKGASDLYSPINGEVTETNADVSANPAQVNASPYGSGWLIKVKVSGENKDLLDEAAYNAWVKEQQH